MTAKEREVLRNTQEIDKSSCADAMSPSRAMVGDDTTVIRLLDGTSAYLHAVIDNFSRRILAWRVADTFAPINSLTVLLDASRAATPSETTPVVKYDCLRNLARRAEPAKRNGAGDHLRALLSGLRRSQQIVETRRVDGARADRVYADLTAL
jgi:hypothetical protein